MGKCGSCVYDCCKHILYILYVYIYILYYIILYYIILYYIILYYIILYIYISIYLSTYLSIYLSISLSLSLSLRVVPRIRSTGRSTGSSHGRASASKRRRRPAGDVTHTRVGPADRGAYLPVVSHPFSPPYVPSKIHQKYTKNLIIQ